MDFDFLDREFLKTARKAITDFRVAVESAKPPEEELEDLCSRIRSYGHSPTVDEDFIVAGVDGSGEFPILQQDDIFVHFVVSAGACYRTKSNSQHKLSIVQAPGALFKTFAILRDERSAISAAYAFFLEDLVGLTLDDLLDGSDYCKVFSSFGKKIRKADVRWESFAFASATQIATHAYQLRSLAELGMAIRQMKREPRYLLLDTSLVYFLLGKAAYLPELVKRYLVTQANRQGTAVVALNKSHNIPNGDLIGRWAREKYGFNDHWYLRLPAESLGEEPLPFLHEKEVPPKLGVSYLFKFHATSFPMRVDLDAAWWKKEIGHDEKAEVRLFRDMDYTCHDVRGYGYPYPLHAAHRSSSLTKQERKAVRDILLGNARSEGILRGAFLRDPEAVHMEGI